MKSEHSAAANLVSWALRRLLNAYADHDGDNRERCLGPRLKPIPGGGAPFKPFGVIVHHNPLNPTVALPDISDPSQITDFDGFVGLTHIQGGGTGMDTSTGVTTPLAYRADMGFGRGQVELMRPIAHSPDCLTPPIDGERNLCRPIRHSAERGEESALTCGNANRSGWIGQSGSEQR